MPFGLFLCISLLLHGLFLVLTRPVKIPLHEVGVVAPLRALNLRLQTKSGRVETLPISPSPRAGSVMPSIAVSHERPVRVTPGRASLPPQSEAIAPSEPVIELRSAPHFDLDDLREQARNLPNAPTDLRVRGTGAHRNLTPAPVQDSLDRPILEALSRRLGKTLVVASEQVMSDGSRMIRFAGNTCLHIPQHLPEWLKNPMGATVLVPTNCPN